MYLAKSKRDLSFGLIIPQGWRERDLPLEENNPVKQYEFSKSISLLADKLDFDSLYAYDHLIPHYSGDIKKNLFECFILLSSIAAITKRVKIGQIVTCNSYRNPPLLAKMLSTLDIVSNGRIELGIGAGWYEQEYNAYGYNFLSNITRIKQLDESLSIIKAMWTESCASFKGEYYTIKDAICNPKPIQKPHPVITIGGSGEKYLLKVVANHADRYNLFFGSPAEMKRKMSILKEYCKNKDKKNGNNLQYSVVLPCIIKESEEEVYKTVSNFKRNDKTIEQYIKYLVEGITIGTPEKILKGINQYIEIGVTHFIFHLIGIDENVLEYFNSNIIRRL